MQEPLRPLELGELLDRTFHFYRGHFRLFVGISALPYLCVLALQVVFALVGWAPSLGARSGITLAHVGTFALFELVLVIASLCALAYATGGTVFAVAACETGESISISSALAKVRGRAAALAAAAACVGLAAGIGFLLLFVPGVLLLLAFAVVFPALVLEDLGPLAALRRSRELTRGFRGRVLAIYVLYFAVLMAVTLTLYAVLGVLIATMLRGHLLPAFTGGAMVTSFLVNSLVGPILTIALALLYFDLKIRKEGLDIQLLLQRANAAAPGA